MSNPFVCYTFKVGQNVIIVPLKSSQHDNDMGDGIKMILKQAYLETKCKLRSKT